MKKGKPSGQFAEFWTADDMRIREEHFKRRTDDILKGPILETPLLAKVRKDMAKRGHWEVNLTTAIGALVSLRSGSPVMTVTGHSNEGPWIEVAWIHNGELRSMRAPYACFKLEAV